MEKEVGADNPDAITWPNPTSELQRIARKLVSDMCHNSAVVLAADETKDDTMFPETAFNKSTIHLSPRKYCHYIG